MLLPGLAKVETNHFYPQPALSSRTRPPIPPAARKINPPVRIPGYEVDGEQYIAIAAGGNQGVGSANGDAVWAFSLKGQLNPPWPTPLATVAGPTGPVAEGDTIKIGDFDIEYSYAPRRARVKSGTTVTFTNVGDTPHTATAFEKGKIGDWDTGVLNSGQSKMVTFDKPGSYYYICTPHPWMYGQVIVE
jgi:plastocyanin